MLKKAMVALVVGLALFVPVMVSAADFQYPMQANHIVSAVDHVRWAEDAMMDAIELFESQAPVYQGDELIRFHNIAMESHQWLVTGIRFLDRAYAKLSMGDFAGATNFANRAKEIFTMLGGNVKD